MHHSNELSESSALVAIHEAERQREIAHRRRLLTARDVLRWPFRALRWLLVVPARTVYRRVRRTRAPRRGWSAGRERSSFLGRPGVTREAKGIKPDDPEVVQRQAELDELIASARQLHLVACDRAERARTPTAAEEQSTRDHGDELQRKSVEALNRAFAANPRTPEARAAFRAQRGGLETQSDMVTPNEGPGSKPLWSRVLRDKPNEVRRYSVPLGRRVGPSSCKPTGPTSDEARKATRALQAERQRKTEAEDQAERDRHLLEGRAAQAEDDRLFEGWIQHHEYAIAARNKGKQ